MKTLPLILILASTLCLHAQETSDADAIEILEQISQDYKKDAQHEIDFFLDIELPGEAKETQAGHLKHEGEKFSLELDGRTIISDGTTLWLFLEEMNEVQINDADMSEDGDLMSSPSDLFGLHRSDQFIFAIAGQIMEDGQMVTQIEGKPTDPDSDYSKVRLTLAGNNKEVKRFKVFSKDGSRFSMRLERVSSSVVFDESTFTFDTTKHPEVHVEDLRF